ncbi:MAG TPA: TRAP transporter small permease [Gammaproteobacteria bacterium]|nr:TRAP transporter small permease [Gammaproteobacteria bacterium]
MTVIRLLNRVEEGIISLLLVALTLLVFVEVVMRFGFGMAIDWAEEGSLLLAGWFVLFGASHGIKTGSHIGVDFVVRAMPSRVRRAVSALAVLACLFYTGMLLLGSWEYLDKVYRIGLPMEDVPLPTWLAQSVLLIGFAMIGIRLLILLWQIVTGQADSFPFSDEAEGSMERLEQEQAAHGGGE